jgi:ribose 1,5-bisphosphokinase PhnN
VIVHITADTDVIKQRMKDDPHENVIFQADDVDKVKKRFAELVDWSLLGNKISIDNSGALVDTMAQFVARMEPLFTDTDRSRILAHKVLSGG